MRGRKQARKPVTAAARKAAAQKASMEQSESINAALREQATGLIDRAQTWERRANMVVDGLKRADAAYIKSQAALRESRYQQARLVTRVEALEHALTLQHAQVKETLEALDKFSDGATKQATADAVLSNLHNVPTRIEFERIEGAGWQHRVEPRG